MVAGLPSSDGLLEKSVPFSSVSCQKSKLIQRRGEPTQARLVVLIGIRKVKVPMKLPVIELHSDSMVCFLINSPHSTSQVQACSN